MRLDCLHQQAVTHPLSHDDLVQLHCHTAKARIVIDPLPDNGLKENSERGRKLQLAMDTGTSDIRAVAFTPVATAIARLSRRCRTRFRG
jgi:hypothetical protein